MKDQTPRSNPLQFLYGGLFVRRSNRGDPALPSVSLASRDSHTLEDVDLEDDAEMLEEDATTPSWWQKLAQSLHGHTLACDEDPSQYDFAFSVRFSSMAVSAYLFWLPLAGFLHFFESSTTGFPEA